MKRAVVTGAGTGVGRALTLHLSSRSVEVLAVGRRLAPLEELAAAATGAPVHVASADVSTDAGRAAITAAVTALGGPLDFVVHNAAGTPLSLLWSRLSLGSLLFF